MSDKVAAEPGQVIAYRNESTLVYDYTDENGLDWGHIVMPDGSSAPQQPLMSILVRGYWTAEPKHG